MSCIYSPFCLTFSKDDTKSDRLPGNVPALPAAVALDEGLCSVVEPGLISTPVAFDCCCCDCCCCDASGTATPGGYAGRGLELSGRRLIRPGVGCVYGCVCGGRDRAGAVNELLILCRDPLV